MPELFCSDRAIVVFGVVGLGPNGHSLILAPRLEWAGSLYMVALLFVQGWKYSCKVKARVSCWSRRRQQLL